MNIKLAQIQDVIRQCVSDFKDSCGGNSPTREQLEHAALEALGYPVELPDYDEQAGVVTKVVVSLPPKSNQVDIDFIVGEE